MLAWTSNFGAQASSYNSQDDDQFSPAVKGYGFASFFCIVGAFMCLSMAVYYSTLICGSPNEKKVLFTPQEIDSIEAGAFNNNPSAPPNTKSI